MAFLGVSALSKSALFLGKELIPFLLILNSPFFFEKSLPQNVYHNVDEWVGKNLCGYLQ